MSDRILYSRCPLCESPNIVNYKIADCSWHRLYHPSLNPRIVWKKCSDCAHVFTEGHYTEEAYKVIFSKTHDIQKVGFAIEQSRYVSAKMVEKVLPYASDGIWLDVGFGNGSLLFTAQEYGFKPVGIDLRPDTVSEMKSFGIDAHCIDLCELSPDEQVSVISMADVLEHIPYPKTALHAAKNLLRDGGILLVSMPNFENAVWEELDQKNQNPYWGEIEHFHNFGRARLYSLLSECGYSPARYGVSERYRCCMEVVAIKN